MTTITATTILRSRNTSAPDKVLSTLLLRYPAFIHQDFMTHRVFSRNAMSTRAIPIRKMLKSVISEMAMPIHWGKNKAGMQADEELGLIMKFIAKGFWVSNCLFSCATSYFLNLIGSHKQVGNMVLWPYMHFTTLVSSTEWENFFELRDHKDARPEIIALAKAIRAELERKDNIQDLAPGEWHLPFTTVADGNLEQRKILSVARCASTSYKTTDGFDMTQDRAERLYSKLFSTPFHSSPFEHQAQADKWDDGYIGDFVHSHEHGNFVGFRQLRKQLEAAL